MFTPFYSLLIIIMTVGWTFVKNKYLSVELLTLSVHWIQCNYWAKKMEKKNHIRYIMKSWKMDRHGACGEWIKECDHVFNEQVSNSQ